jgi:hypothetical protein
LASRSTTSSWREWTTGVAFAALLISLFAGVIAVWPRRASQERLPGGSVKSVDDYAKMKPEDFVRQQCDEAYTRMTTGSYASIINFRINVFRVQTVSLVIGGVLIGINSLVPTAGAPQSHQPAGKHGAITCKDHAKYPTGTHCCNERPAGHSHEPANLPTRPFVPAPPLWRSFSRHPPSSAWPQVPYPS